MREFPDEREIQRRLRDLEHLDFKVRLRDRLRIRRTRKPSRSRHHMDWRTPLALIAVVAAGAAVVVLHPSSVPAPIRQALGIGPERMLPAVRATTSGSFAYLQTELHSSTPVRWDPCKPIHYVINPAGAPADGVAVMRSAIDEAQTVTGLKFVYDGVSDRRPDWSSHTVLANSIPDDPVLISWATAAEVGKLAGNVAGLGGATAFPVHGRLTYTTGGVTLDADDFGDIASRPGGAAEERAIDLHELGHLVGLAHVKDQTQLMYADNVGQLGYGGGDLAGLAALGNGPCN